jgi:hypothetical protein
MKSMLAAVTAAGVVCEVRPVGCSAAAVTSVMVVGWLLCGCCDVCLGCSPRARNPLCTEVRCLVSVGFPHPRLQVIDRLMMAKTATRVSEDALTLEQHQQLAMCVRLRPVAARPPRSDCTPSAPLWLPPGLHRMLWRALLPGPRRCRAGSGSL